MKEIEIKMRCQFLSIRLAKMKKSDTLWAGVQGNKIHTLSMRGKLTSSFWRAVC